MTGLVSLAAIAEFAKICDVPPESVPEAARVTVRELHEVEQIEPAIRDIISDRSATPHGPAELVDIFTHQLTIDGKPRLSAFILKGRSTATIRARDVAHQIYRLEKLAGLELAIFAFSGVLLDAAREQFTSTCKRLGLRYALLHNDDLARLFIAYGKICPRDGSLLKNACCACGYRWQHDGLNILQIEALQRLVELRASGGRRGLVIMPTGAGKTRVAATDAVAADARRVLYVAHSHEILDVAEKEFANLLGGQSVARLTVHGGRQTRVSLATVQQLARSPKLLSEGEFDYIVVDEFHHAAAASYRRLVSSRDDAFLLGLTATPFRGDRQDITQLCGGTTVVNFGLRFGIEAGILSPYHYHGCFDATDYGDIALEGYSLKDLERKLIIGARHRAVIAKWRELARNKATVAFCSSEVHASKVAKAFAEAGIPAAVYLGKTPRVERTRLAGALQTGDIRVLCAVDVLNEGVDVPFVECLLFLRPTESKRIFLQQLGRGLRRNPGKSHCMVIDFIGNFRNASKVLEYHDLRADEPETHIPSWSGTRAARQILDLPMNCTVTFDDRVLDIFEREAADPRYATRGTIGPILMMRYKRLSDRLGRPATKKEVDRYDYLGSDFHKQVFGSWAKFQAAIERLGA